MRRPAPDAAARPDELAAAVDAQINEGAPEKPGTLSVSETYVCPARPGRHLIFPSLEVEFVERPGRLPHVKRVVLADAARLDPATEIRADAAAELLAAGALAHCTAEGTPLR